MIKAMMRLTALLTLLGGCTGESMVSRVEQARYRVVTLQGAIEVRDYASMIVAETVTEGDRKSAIRAGFRTLADYIFGNNQGSRKVAMTAPVLQQPGARIAMTAPVLQQPEEERWIVRFVMPADWTLATLPRPNQAAVSLKEIPARRYAVIRFSGTADSERLVQQTAQLQAFLEAQSLRPRSAPTYAFYNPPWTLPFLRRNEVMIEVDP